MHQPEVSAAPGIAMRLAAAAAIAREAGLLARRLFDEDLSATFKSHQEYVTDADTRVEKLIRTRLATLFPDDAVLGEELGGTAGEHTWILDPIDGTANFAHRHPGFAVSIAYLQHMVPVVGAVHVPMTDVLYTASRAGGAFRNGLPIAASSCTDARRAYIELGYSPRSNLDEYLRVLSTVLGAGMLARWSGSAVLSLMQVAEGSSDAYFDLHLNPWDVAAGLVIVAEAGGRVSDFFAGDGIASGNPLLAAARDFQPAFSDVVMRELSGSSLADPRHGLRQSGG